MNINDPIWSYGKNVLINSIKTNVTPRWSYGRSTLRQDFIGELFIRAIIDTVGIIDILSRSITFVRSIINTIGIIDILVKSIDFIRKIVDIFNMSDILNVIKTRFDWFGVCKIVGIKTKEKLLSKVRKVHEVDSPKIKGK